jgi:tetratricopeptide (TPR) repeat protein
MDEMKSYTFFPFGDEQNQRPNLVLQNIDNARQEVTSSYGKPLLEDKYLRSCALNSAEQGDYTEAIDLLSLLIHRHPQNAVDYNNRGLIYFQSGESQKAFVDYNTALELNPNLASAYNNRANYYAACGELSSAIEDYDRAIDLNPSHVRAWINRGITLRDLGKYEEAIDNFEAALLFKQLEGHIIAQRGRTYHIWGEWNVAVADYRRALSLLPSTGVSRSQPGWRLRLQVESWLDELF